MSLKGLPFERQIQMIGKRIEKRDESKEKKPREQREERNEKTEKT